MLRGNMTATTLLLCRRQRLRSRKVQLVPDPGVTLHLKWTLLLVLGGL